MKRLQTVLLAILPLVILAGVTVFFHLHDPTKSLRASFPPIEELTVQRLILTKDGITAKVVNAGPEPVTIAQVLVDDAYWDHKVEPSRVVPRLGHADVFIPYPWVEGETHMVKLMSSTGLPFEKEIAVAVESPQPSRSFVLLFAILGLYVGVLPVGLGLIWFPVLRRTPETWLSFFLFLTIGLLVFLGLDALQEALEVAHELPGAFQGTGLIFIGAAGCFGLLTLIQRSLSNRKQEGGSQDHETRLGLSYMVALGIGLHNLSEGLAIGSAYALGNIALGSLLVIGFMLHNTTEGLAIVAPVARQSVQLRHLVFLGLLGGAPTILGAWIGGFSYSAVLALLFLAIGAGAIFQVAYQITSQMARSAHGGISGLVTLPNAAGLLFGLLIMYGTGLMVAM